MILWWNQYAKNWDKDIQPKISITLHANLFKKKQPTTCITCQVVLKVYKSPSPPLSLAYYKMGQLGQYNKLTL